MSNGKGAARTALPLAIVLAMALPSAAAGQQPVGGPWDWSRVQRIESGSAIALSVRGSTPLRYRMATADDSNLVVLAFRNADALSSVHRVLRLVGRDWPSVLAARKAYNSDSVLISHNGVFDRGRKLADIVAIPRDDVSLIRGLEHNDTRGAIIGAIAGSALGVAMLVRSGWDRGDSVGEGLVGVGTVFGTGGAAIGYLVTRQGVGPLIYEAPPRGTPDAAAWARLRQTLPPSLRGRPGTTNDQ